MSDHLVQHLSDEEIIAKVHEEQEAAAELGKERFGDLADAIDIFRYRIYEWMEHRSVIRPIHGMFHLYRSNPSLARELAVSLYAKSALTSMMSTAVLLRSGIIMSIPAVSRVAHELYIDASFLRLDDSGGSAIRMLDWQFADTARIDSDNPDLQAIYESVKQEYIGDKNFGKPGMWAELPNGKKYHSFEARMRYVYSAMEEEVPDHIVGEGSWSFLKRMARDQRAQASATMHASPLASAHVNSQIFMAMQAALYASQTVAVHRRVSDDWLDENVSNPLSELGTFPFLHERQAWERLEIARQRFSLVMRQTLE